MLVPSAILFVVIFIAAGGTLLLARCTGSMASVWAANGIAAGAMLTVSKRHWPPYLIAIAAGLLAGQYLSFGLHSPDDLWVPLILVPANLIEILVVAAAIRHYVPRIIEHHTHYLRLGAVAIGATLAACAASTLLAMVTRYFATGDAFLGTANEWFRAHLLGMVIVGTLTLVALRQRGRMLGPPGQRLRMWCEIALLAAITAGVFAQVRFPLLFVIFGPVLYLVFQYRFPGLVVGMAIVAIITNVGTALGSGPFDLIQHASAGERALVAQIFLGTLCAVAVPVALTLADRQRLSFEANASESRYRLLADYASDLIMRIARDGTRRYVSPSVRDILGWEPDEYAASRGSMIHPDDYERVMAVVAQLWLDGIARLTCYRIRSKSGEYRWFEALARVAPSPDHPGEVEMVYIGRDVTARIAAEQALADSELRLRTITDNIPALIAQLDAGQRYVFINAYARTLIGRELPSILGRSVEEARPSVYPTLKPHIDKVLDGKITSFEYHTEFNGRRHYLHATYLPIVNSKGERNGFYTLTTDITKLKRAEQKLAFLAHHDTLTGIANRLAFHNGIELAIQHAAMAREPLLVMMIDVDHFKQINDTHGHAAGDAALREVAARLKTCVRKSDLLARLGGDEFVILCRDIGDATTAEALVRSVAEAMKPPVDIEGVRLQVTLSIGATLHAGATTADALLQRADEALYQVKESGRNGYRLNLGDL